VHTPRFCGQLSRAGLEVFHRGGLRPKRTSWLKVGTNLPLCVETLPASAIRDIRIPHRFSTQQAFFEASNKRGLLAFLTGPCSRRGDRWNLGASLPAGLVTQQAVAQEQKATLAEPFHNTRSGRKSASRVRKLQQNTKRSRDQRERSCRSERLQFSRCPPCRPFITCGCYACRLHGAASDSCSCI